MSPSRDFHRDWNRWTRAECVTAAVLGALVAIGLPAAILINVLPF